MGEREGATRQERKVVCSRDSAGLQRDANVERECIGAQRSNKAVRSGQALVEPRNGCVMSHLASRGRMVHSGAVRERGDKRDAGMWSIGQGMDVQHRRIDCRDLVEELGSTLFQVRCSESSLE